ncbi:hypothetical protein SAMN05444412_104158 [Rhodonellum ikkaensis]|uniref:Uncharacterized protein n=1 Tax=Rhodonellum ikkaensis TaxID=336829 RepID=A0A1H3PAI9_9BACT|nr:hypothetical protein SAMN05444412_104158 [Rhodonellum ikkaensis]
MQLMLFSLFRLKFRVLEMFSVVAFHVHFSYR